MSTAQQIMRSFAARTGLGGDGELPTRYLWTDAFAVCNFLGLYRSTGEVGYLEEALALVHQVHQALGRHRPDDPRQGWISGLSEADGERHPTRGGLRIGKRLPERQHGQPLDEHLEWDRDGQYFHYLTKWMHALERVARVCRDPEPLLWAHELAESTHPAFVLEPPPGGRKKRMAWKLSIDLSHPLVPSMGHHDPLNGLITYQQIRSTAEDLGLPSGEYDLASEIADMEAMCEGRSWLTADSLGIGCLLVDACRLAELVASARLPESQRLEFMLREAVTSLAALNGALPLDAPAERRLAFREFGLSIGLHAVDHICPLLQHQPERFPNRLELLDLVALLQRFHGWSDSIESFWQNPRHQQSENWQAHQDINCVMLATSLAPDGFLVRSPLPPPI